MIQLKDLSVGYGSSPVLTGVELELRAGEVLVLLGPNGSGKSTLIRTMLGLLPQLGGQVLVDGLPLSQLSLKQRARAMAYLAQSRGIPSITVERLVLHGRFPHLDYPRRYGREDCEVVRNVMEGLDILELAQRPLEQLSGGQRQRAYLAMALAQDTPYLLFDEPTSYLDVGRQLEVMETARALAREGRGVALVIHDLTLAIREADRLAVLDGGRLLRVGTPDEIYESGILPQVFGVDVGRLAEGNSWRYYYK